MAVQAIGWALRELSKTDPQAVRKFVADNMAVLSPLSQKEALKRIGAGSSKSRSASTGKKRKARDEDSEEEDGDDE